MCLFFFFFFSSSRSPCRLSLSCCKLSRWCWLLWLRSTPVVGIRPRRLHRHRHKEITGKTVNSNIHRCWAFAVVTDWRLTAPSEAAVIPRRRWTRPWRVWAEASRQWRWSRRTVVEKKWRLMVVKWLFRRMAWPAVDWRRADEKLANIITLVAVVGPARMQHSRFPVPTASWPTLSRTEWEELEEIWTRWTTISARSSRKNRINKWRTVDGSKSIAYNRPTYHLTYAYTELCWVNWLLRFSGTGKAWKKC